MKFKFLAFFNLFLSFYLFIIKMYLVDFDKAINLETYLRLILMRLTL